jgi:aquaporin Z
MAELRMWLLPLAWFVAVTAPILLFASTSGAHLNPVVTLALAIRRRIRPSHAAAYAATQFAGGFVGSAAVLVGAGTADHLGATYPSGSLPWDFAGETAFTFLLVLSVLFIVERGTGRGRWRLLLPGAVVGVSTFVIGPWTRSSLNPARTLAPAVLTGLVGDLWLYFLSAPLGALLAVLAWRAYRTPVATATAPTAPANALR